LVKRLPPVKEILGVSFGSPDSDYVHLQYRADEEAVCELLLPIDQALIMEEYFIKVRNQLAGRNLQRRNSKPQSSD
jgi:hypothetical protein